LKTHESRRTKPKLYLGLIAGEGSFYGAPHFNPDRYKHNVKIRAQFSIKMDNRDNEVLQLCHQGVGLGTFYEHDGYGYWRISSKVDLQDMVDYVEKHAGEGFRSTDKYKSFETWKRIVEIVGEPYKRLSKDETLRCIELAKDTNAGSEDHITEEEWKERVK